MTESALEKARRELAHFDGDGRVVCIHKVGDASWGMGLCPSCESNFFAALARLEAAAREDGIANSRACDVTELILKREATARLAGRLEQAKSDLESQVRLPPDMRLKWLEDEITRLRKEAGRESSD